jgi:hypothetical protein
MSKEIADIATKLVVLLDPLDVERRRKAINAALVILGDPPRETGARKDADQSKVEGELPSGDGWPKHTKLRTWMRQNSITDSQIAQLFHLDDGKVNVIASTVAGAKGGEKSRNAYLLQGLAAMIESGEPTFTDEDARNLCRHLGCYDKNNHSNYVRAMGNKATGSKKSGLKLTSPGLTAAAKLVKDMTGETQ